MFSQTSVPYNDSSCSHLEDMIEITGAYKKTCTLKSSVQPGAWDNLLRVVTELDSDGVEASKNGI
jgi:hypothetical protein